MSASFVAKTISPSGGRLGFLLAMLVISWFAGLALATPFDHDESQYVAGALFSTKMLIFRDFLYLQPPLHAWAYAPVAWAFPTTMVIAMRLVTAMTALGTLAALWAAQRRAGVSRSSAIIATLLIAATAAFQFTASVVRNDMLPTLLSSLALLLVMAALRSGRRLHWVGAGLLFGLAIATKLNFAPLGLAVGLFAIANRGRCGLRAAMMLAAGALIGTLPMLAIGAAAPEAFVYGVLQYGAVAPHAWYAANGAGDELSLLEKLADLLKYLVRGPALMALLLLALHGLANRRRPPSPERKLPEHSLIVWMIVGALIGAALPTPTQVQYLMPVLVPLALALGYLLDDAHRWSPTWRYALLGLLGLAAIPSLWGAARDMTVMLRDGSAVIAATRDARWAGDRVRAMTGDDEILTLSPHMVADSGLTIDPRLATGPFVYRTGWTLDPDRARLLHTLTPATIPDLNRDRPDAILVGYEAGTRNLPLRPDDMLTAYAVRNGYRMLTMPDGIGRLFVWKNLRSDHDQRLEHP